MKELVETKPELKQRILDLISGQKLDSSCLLNVFNEPFEPFSLLRPLQTKNSK